MNESKVYSGIVYDVYTKSYVFYENTNTPRKSKSNGKYYTWNN